MEGKWSNPEKGVVPSPTLRWCSRFWKESLRVPLDYSRPTYLIVRRTIQFNMNYFLYTVKWLNISIGPIPGALSDATTPGQSGPGSNVNEEVIHIPQSSNTEAPVFDRVYYHTQNISFIGHYHVQPLPVRVNQRVMVMKVYSTFPKALRLELHHPIRFSVIFSTVMGARSDSTAEMQSEYSTAPPTGFSIH